MSQVRPKGERVGEIAAKAVVQLLFATGKSFTVDGLREKLREFFRQEVRAELRAVAALNNVKVSTAAMRAAVAATGKRNPASRAVGVTSTSTRSAMACARV
jgi:hypothetical protein